MEKFTLKKNIQNIQQKLNIPITPENAYIGIAKHDADKPKLQPQTQTQNAKYLDELYSADFIDNYFS